MSQTNGYGTNGRNGGVRATLSNHIRNVADEAQPLLNGDGGSRASPKSLVNRLSKAARKEVKRDWADVVLIFCYIITGLLDSASISIWGSFVSMQTGQKQALNPQSLPLYTCLSEEVKKPKLIEFF